LHYEEIS